MEDISTLLAVLEAMHQQPADHSPQDWERLRRGMLQVQQTVEGLRQQVQQLQARRASLEAQVMDMAEQPEPPSPWWEKVIILYGDEDDPDPFDSPQDTGVS